MCVGHRPSHLAGKGWGGEVEYRTPWRRNSATGELVAQGSYRVEILVGEFVSKQTCEDQIIPTGGWGDTAVCNPDWSRRQRKVRSPWREG